MDPGAGMNQLLNKLLSPSTCFVAVNCFCTFGSIAQYILFMRLFEFKDMGSITYFHTIITLTGMTQIGLLNGGFRIFSQKTPWLEPRVNNTVFSFFGFIFLAALALLLFRVIMPGYANPFFVPAAIMAGCLTMMKTWLTNVKIAKSELTRLNWVNVITTCFSFLFFLTIPYGGVFSALLVVTSIPLTFCLFYLASDKKMRPVKFSFQKRTLLWILYFGFVPFLTGVMTMINLEIGNLGIKLSIGEEELGKFTLVQLYTNCFMLIPNSITLIFYPKMFQAYANRDQASMTKLCRRILLLDVLYVFCAVIGTLTVFPFVINLLFPKYHIALPFVYCVLPGLCMATLFISVNMILYVNLILKPVFIIYLCSVFLTIAGILIFHFSGIMSLSMMAVMKCLISVFISLSIGLYCAIYNKKLRVRYSIINTRNNILL